MARRRMYVFERAYVDYAGRLRGFGRRLGSTCGTIWDWFWSGAGAAAIEAILRLAIVATAVGASYAYVSYEKAHGRGFSAATLGAIAAIGVFTTLVLWGWKGPVHFAARVLAGALATGTILFAAALVLTPAVAVFSVYLLALLLLTALSIVVFLPMRGAHSLWLLYRRIAYRCPYDDDGGAHGLPIHVCSCGTWYDDLQPSFYGIFHHVCRHEDGTEVKLPTMDFLGRNQLPRLCRGCQKPLVLSAVGELAERPISVVGGPSSGKTVFLRQSIRGLRERLAAWPGGSVALGSEVQERQLVRDLALLDEGQVVAKTSGDVIEAFGLAVRIPQRLRCLLYLYDAPGEHFLTVERFGRKQALRHVAGLVLLVDPFSLPALADHSRRRSPGLHPSESPFHQVVDVLVAGVDLMLVRRPTDVCDVPLAIVLSKADTLPSEDFPFLADLVSRPSLNGSLPARCRQALDRLGGGNSLRALEQKFSRVGYFACSALGRLPDLHRRHAFQPVGVLEPWLWLLGLDSQEAGSKH